MNNVIKINEEKLLSTGTLYLIAHEVYILASVSNRLILICLGDGEQWCEPKTMDDMITELSSHSAEVVTDSVTIN